MPEHLTEIVRAFRESAGEDELRPLIISLSLMAILVGVQLVMPYDTFGPRGPYRILNRVPEWALGYAFIFLGALKMYINLTRGRPGLFRDPERGKNVRGVLSVVIHAVLVLLWGFLFVVSLVTMPHGLLLSLSFGMVLGCFWCGVRRLAELSIRWN